jgi:iron complex outermembrane recepter protein
MSIRKFQCALSGLIFAGIIGILLSAPTQAQGGSYHFDISNQTLSQALRSYGQISGQEIIFTEDIVAGQATASLKGDYTAQAALERLLRGTGLVAERSPSGAIMIRRPQDHDPSIASPTTMSPDQAPYAGGALQIAQTDSKAADVGATPNSFPAAPAEKDTNGQVHSSGTDWNTLEEVVVTANRREESLSKVPISVSAFTQEAMDLRGIRDFSDVARFTPGVQIDANGTNSISIRGISSSRGAGTTGIYIDDTPIQMRPMGVNADDTLPKTFDMARVEVLRGPQGTLFGAGSEGGTVRYIMTQPDLHEYSSYARSEVSYTEGGSPNYEAGLALGGPIVDGTLGFRVSVWYRRDGGYIDLIDPTTLKLVDKNTNHDETTVLRAAMTWAPTSDVKVTPSIVWQDRERHDVENYWPLYSNAGSNNFVSADFSPLSEPDVYFLPSLKITADFGGTEFISNTSYYRRRDTSGYDATLYNLSYYQTLGWLPNQGGGNASGSGPYAGTSPCAPQGFSCYPLLDGSGVRLPAAIADYRASGSSVTNQQDNVSQEFRLQSTDPAARVVWTVGAFFSVDRSYSLEAIRDPMVDELFKYLYGTTIANVFSTPTNPNGSSYLPMGDSYFNELTGHDRQLAGFGEAVWSLTDRLKLTTGLRYSKTDFGFVAYNDGPQNFGPGGFTGSERANPITKRVGLSFQEDPNNLYYATFSTGFRIGGANSTIPESVCGQDFTNFGITSVPTSYKPDTVKNYEIGAKNNFDNRIKLASSIYYIQWIGIQQSVVLPTCGLGYTANVGTAISEGGDVQADFAVTNDFTIESSIGYTDAHYTENALAGPLSTTPLVEKGDSITGESGTPPAPWTIAVGAEYKFRAFGGRASFARLDVEHDTKSNRPTSAEDPATVQYGSCTTNSGAIQSCNFTPSATTFVSLRAGSKFGGWDVSAFIDNLLDTHPITNFNYQPTDGFGPQPAASPLYRNFTFRPRTFGVTVTFRQ